MLFFKIGHSLYFFLLIAQKHVEKKVLKKRSFLSVFLLNLTSDFR